MESTRADKRFYDPQNPIDAKKLLSFLINDELEQECGRVLESLNEFSEGENDSDEETGAECNNITMIPRVLGSEKVATTHETKMLQKGQKYLKLLKSKIKLVKYVKGKPCPWGIKIIVLCGSSGMAYDFIIYQGSTTELDKQLLAKFGRGATVILKLSERIQRDSFLFFDNYYTTYNLLEVLRQKQSHGARTIRVNRFGEPPLLPDKDIMKKNREYCKGVISEDGIVLCEWLDNRCVTLGSNFVGKGDVDTACSNSRLEYVADVKAIGLPEADILDSLHFEMRVAEWLIRQNRPAELKWKAGRPSSSSTSSKLILKFPVKNDPLCRQWILHSGNISLADLSPKSLRKKFICCQHFSGIFLNSRKLPPTAIPEKYTESDDEEDNMAANEQMLKIRYVDATYSSHPSTSKSQDIYDGNSSSSESIGSSVEQLIQLPSSSKLNKSNRSFEEENKLLKQKLRQAQQKINYLKGQTLKYKKTLMKLKLQHLIGLMM
ncbi:hypothetical protein JTB14_002035 [Gonioctena quinquepunctata]|nr:hypothetical protein JTB14_002035 [Gonioctena quinquepunctata]